MNFLCGRYASIICICHRHLIKLVWMMRLLSVFSQSSIHQVKTMICNVMLCSVILKLGNGFKKEMNVLYKDAKNMIGQNKVLKD